MEKFNANNIKKQEKKAVILRNTIVYSFLFILGLLIIIPFYWMVITALKSGDEVVQIPVTFFPKEFHFENFIEAMSRAPFTRYIFNTLFVGVVSTLGTLITTILAAFAFSRLEFRGKGLLFSILLATMMIPGEMMVITNYVTVAKLDWINTYKALIFPFVASVFYIFLLRQNFKQIPDELYFAAKVDGTSDFKYMWRIMVPIAMPTIISITILKVIGSWNAYIWPNLVAPNDKMRLITNGLRKVGFSSGGERPELHLQMAAAFIVSLPLLIAFIFLRKYIMRGVSNSGTKG
ncbi:carbohydrate ABC transporter permease [Mycoplasmatota bacterium WC44]